MDNANENTMSAAEQLKAFGYGVARNVIPEDTCKKAADALDELEKKVRAENPYLHNAQRTLLNVHIARPDIFLPLINIPAVMATLKEVLGENFILANFNASNSGPGGGRRTHIDSEVPVSTMASTLHTVCMLCLDDFKVENGATNIWPNTHTSGLDPRHLRDKIDLPGRMPAVAPRGSVVYLLGQTWHDVGANTSGERRWGIIAYYCRWFVKPAFDFTNCGEEIFSKLSTEQKQLFSFNLRPPGDLSLAPPSIRTVRKAEEIPARYEDAVRWNLSWK